VKQLGEGGLMVFVEGKVIDKACLSEVGGGEQARIGLGFVYRGEGRFIAEGHVVDRVKAVLLETLLGIAEGIGDVGFVVDDTVADVVQGCVEVWGDTTLVRAQVKVTGRHRQAIGFAHCWDGDNGGRKGKVAGHAANQLELLKVFFAKHGVVGAGQLKQAGNDSQHTGKVVRAVLTAQTIG